MDQKCKQCKWFKGKVPGREEKTCEELGERPNNPACDSFSPLTTEHDGYTSGLLDIFYELFKAEQDSEQVKTMVSSILNQQGAKVDLDNSTFDRYRNNLMDIALLHKLSLLFGLAPYTDEIVKGEVRSRFWKRKSDDEE